MKTWLHTDLLIQQLMMNIAACNVNVGMVATGMCC